MNSQRAWMLDTNVVSYIMGGDPIGERYEALLEGTEPCVSCVTVAEMYYGATKAGWGARRRAELNALISNYRVLYPDWSITLTTARMRAERLKVGRPLSDADAWIAATAVCHGLPLLSHDRDFEGIEGLQLVTLLPPDMRRPAHRQHGPTSLRTIRRSRTRPRRPRRYVIPRRYRQRVATIVVA
jgi:tRNA(fMet)-specific endonuclease VapC